MVVTATNRVKGEDVHVKLQVVVFSPPVKDLN